MAKSKLSSEIEAEVGNMQAARPGAPASKVGLDANGKWEGKDDGVLSDEDIAALDSVKHDLFADELSSLNDFLGAPMPERPTTGEEVSDFRDYLKATRMAKARRQLINRALGSETPTV
jgi:hypothetical protein